MFFMISLEMENHGTIVGATWEEIIPGCTDPYADNYNENANSEDESCSGYPDNGEYSLSFDGVDDYIGQFPTIDNFPFQHFVGLKPLTI